MRFLTRSALVAAALMAVCAPASAVSWTIVPASGRPWNTQSYADTTLSDSSVKWRDSKCYSVDAVWMTPVQIDTTGATTYSGKVWAYNGSANEGGSTCTRLVGMSPTSNGYVAGTSGCSGTIIGTYGSDMGALGIPARYTLFAQTSVYIPTGTCDSSMLRAIQVTR